MRRIVFLVVASMLLPSCCRKPVESSFRQSDSVRVESQREYVEILRDTVVYVDLPEERSSVVRQDSSRLRTTLAESVARIESDGTLSHSLHNLPVRLPVTVKAKDTRLSEVRDSVRLQYIDRTVTVRERFVPRFYRICFWMVVAGIIVLSVRWYLRSRP